MLSYIQVEVDEHDRPGYFILTGSQNFLVNEKITQSLAGRIGILTLLPLSLDELLTSNLSGNNVDDLIFQGGYPRLYKKQFKPMWNTLAETDPQKNYLIYGGTMPQERSLGNVVGWKDAARLIKKIESQAQPAGVDRAHSS